MATFDRSYTTFYWSVFLCTSCTISVVIIIALSATVFELFDVNNIVTLKSGLEVTQGHSNRYHSKAWVRFLTVTMTLSCIICEIKRDIGRKS